MSTNTNSTAHKGIKEEKEAPMPEEDIDEVIKNDEISSSRLFKSQKQVLDAMVQDRIKRGMSEEEALADAKKVFTEVVKEKQAGEKYVFGEFDNDFLKVYMNDSFLGAVSLEVTKIPDATMPTAYVGCRPNGKSHEVIMGFNPKFFRNLNSKQRQGVIKHEMYHLIFQHIFDRAVGDKEYQTLWNWATDLAINSIIKKENLPDACLIPGHLPTDPKTGKPIEGPYADFIKDAPELQSSDFYFEKLREIQQKHGKKSLEVAIGQGMGTMDDHDRWEDLPKEVQEALREKVGDMLDRAVKRAERTQDWGSIPYEIQEVIRKLLSREIDWRSVLRGFVGRCRTMERNSTIKRINKKAPYLFPGVKRKYRAKFGVFIDQSGSMADEDIALLFSELEIAAQYTDLDVFHFDTELDMRSHTVWSKGKAFPPAHRTRCGGTSFQCIADYCNKHENRGRWSGIFILTDGYAPTMGQILNTRVMWVITEHGTMDAVRPTDMAVQMKKERQFKRY
jgi:predicted metal-dependent peptidase